MRLGPKRALARFVLSQSSPAANVVSARQHTPGHMGQQSSEGAGRIWYAKRRTGETSGAVCIWPKSGCVNSPGPLQLRALCVGAVGGAPQIRQAAWCQANEGQKGSLLFRDATKAGIAANRSRNTEPRTGSIAGTAAYDRSRFFLRKCDVIASNHGSAPCGHSRLPYHPGCQVGPTMAQNTSDDDRQAS